MAQPPLSKTEMGRTYSALKKAGWNQLQAAATLGLPPGTMATRVAKLRSLGWDIPLASKGYTPGTYEPKQFRDRIKARIDKKQKADLERQLFEAQEKVKTIEYVKDHSHVVRMNPPTLGKKRPAVAVALGSDHHIEEEVDPETVNGKNAYNLAIAERRMERWIQGIIWKTRHHLHSYDIKRLLLCLMGDFISGAIHPDLVETAQLSPVKAIVWWVARMQGGIDLLLKELPDISLDIPCVVGNHERTTEKIRVATRVENSFGYLAYTMLAEHYRDNPRVKFHIAAGAHAYAEIWSWTLRISHGDDVRYQGGVGGLTIPLRKAVDAWSEATRADYTVIGHWHTLYDAGFAVINGSLIGYSPYSQWIKARYEPPAQAYFLIDKARGKDMVSAIWVDPQGSRR